MFIFYCILTTGDIILYKMHVIYRIEDLLQSSGIETLYNLRS